MKFDVKKLLGNDTSSDKDWEALLSARARKRKRKALQRKEKLWASLFDTDDSADEDLEFSFPKKKSSKSIRRKEVEGWGVH